MNTLTMRSYAGEPDLQAIADLINACEAVDRLDEGTSVCELRLEFDAPSVDKARDIRALGRCRRQTDRLRVDVDS